MIHDKLKPCPFCGGEARRVGRNNGNLVLHTDAAEQRCPATGYATIEAWNKRAEA